MTRPQVSAYFANASRWKGSISYRTMQAIFPAGRLPALSLSECSDCVFMTSNLTAMLGEMFLPRQNQSNGFDAMMPPMSTPYALADVAALVGEPTPAAILLALLDGRPLPAGAPPPEAKISPAATSLHLSTLTPSGVLSGQPPGRRPL